MLRPAALVRRQLTSSAVACGLLFVGPYEASAQSAVFDLTDEAAWPVCPIGADPLVRIGSDFGDPAYLFDGVSDATFLADGRVAVLSRNSDEIRIFTRSGELSVVLGREGEGPGEFSDPIELELVGSDSLAVWDWALDRVTIFPLYDGEPRTVRLDPPPLNPTGDFGILQETRRFVVGEQEYRPPGRGPDDGLQGLQLLAYSPEGALLDTVVTLPYGRLLWVNEANREVHGPVFEPRGTFHVGHDQIYIANGREPRVETASGPEPTQGAIEWDPPDRRVDRADVAAARSEDLDRFSDSPLLERVRRTWDVIPANDEFPALEGLLVGEGAVWVQRYRRPGSELRTWWRFGVDDRLHCAVTFSDGFVALDFEAQEVLGVVRDEFDVEYVEVRTIRTR